MNSPIPNTALRSLRLFLLVGLAVGTGVEAASAQDRVLLDGVAAHVDRHAITVGEVLTVMEPVRRQLVTAHTGRDLRERLRQAYDEALQALIERRLVLDAYAAGPGRIPGWAVDRRAREALDESFEGDRAALLDALAREHLTYAEWRQRLEQQIVFSSMRTTSVEQHVTITPDAVARYYEDHRDTFRTPERVHVRLIMLRRTGAAPLATRADAEALAARLAAGEDFATLARERSSGVHAAAGGDWGWVEPAVLRPELAGALEGLTPGEVSPVIETAGEYYLLKLEGRQAATVQPFLEAQADIERRLRIARVQELYDAWITRLRADAAVQVVDNGRAPF